MRARTGSTLAGIAAAMLCVVATSAAARIDVPIQQYTMRDGAIRYAVPVTVGNGVPIEAELDTGSLGLRVLAAAVKPDSYEATGLRRTATFSGGETFEGVLARASIGVGPGRTSEPLLVMVIEHASCVAARPNCYASRVKPEDYRISGDAADHGFEAILGISLREPAGEDGTPNPLPRIGGSWIVSLPRPGSSEAGHLIIDPDPGERAGFSTMQLKKESEVSSRWSGWADTVLPGCLVGTDGRAPLCAGTVLDTGYPGFSIGTSDVSGPQPYGAGKSVRFEIGGSDGLVSVPFITGSDNASRVFLHPLRDGTEAKIIAGALSFLAYDVLYDARSGTVGFRRREPQAPR